MGAENEAVAKVYAQASHAALTEVVGRFRSDRKLRKLLAGHTPSPKDEEAVAPRFSMPTGDMRRMGYDLRELGRDDEERLMQDLSAAFCRQFTEDYPELRLDSDRLTVLCWLAQVSGSDMFDGTNSLRAAFEDYAKTGSTTRLRSAVGRARTSMESPSRWPRLPATVQRRTRTEASGPASRICG